MKKLMTRLLTGVLTLATVFTALPVTQVQAADSVYTHSDGKTGTVVKVTDGGEEASTFEEGWMKADGETAYCIQLGETFQSGYKTRKDATERLSEAQITDVALNLEYVKEYTKKGFTDEQAYLLQQCTVWRRLSVHLGWGYKNTHVAYDEISKSEQDKIYENAKAFAKENKDRYDCGGYIYTGEGQDLGQFWAKLAVGNGKIQKSSSNTTITSDNDCYSLSGAAYGVYSDKGCTKSVATLTTNRAGNTDTVELRAGTYYVKETKAPKGFQLDKEVYTLTVKAGETATLKVSDTPKVTDTLIELFKIDMETSNSTPQGNAALEGAEFVWKYYDGYYTKENLPSQPTRTWTTKTKAEKGSDNAIHYITRLADSYKVSGDSFYTQNGTICLPLGTITVEEKTAPKGYLLDGAYMQANGNTEKINGVYVAQITEDEELAKLSGYNQYSVSDKVIRGGVKIQKRDLETKDTKPQGGAALKYTAFEITSLNDNAVLVDGKLYKKNEVVKTIHTGVDGIATTAADTLPYGHYRIDEVTPPEGYLKDGAVSREFDIVNDSEIVDLTSEEHSIYNQIKRGDIEGVKIGSGTHKRLANVPFKITSKTTGESHIIVTDKNGQFSTAADWVSHKQNTNAGKTSEDGIWFGTSEPDDSKGALLYDTYEIEELRCDSNKGLKLIPAFDVVVSRNKVVIDLGTLTDEYEPEISIHTTAADKATGEKMIIAGKDVTIVDTVTLDGLEKGTKYQLKGWEMVKSENAELIVDGERVGNDYTFTAKDSKMEVEIAFTFNASALGGKDLVTFEELYDLTNPDEPVKVAEHKDIEDEGQTVTIEERVIEIHTNAADKATGEKMIVAGKEVTVIDTVTLDGLEKGTTYQLKGWQMVKSENALLLIDGQPVESDYTFTAEDSSMEVEIAFTFNASALAGKDLVTFEELYDLSNPDEPTKVAEHKDIKDDGQTVTITERIITMHTTATDKVTSEKTIEAGKNITIVDTVTLDGLEKGTKYTLKGWEMVKSENAELIINGKRVENDLTFTATDTKMEVQIEFTFNASELGGKELVTFEELYDTTNPDNPIKVAEHKDIKDEGQTVTIKEAPTPEKPTTPEEPSTPHKTGTSPKTGDNTPFAALFAMMGISAAGLIFAGYKRFRRVKKSK
ncbi:VaFE repeat-containing surface-anchored protein [Mediterraneibacter agrestimuris]|uniref:VaFE repeat-containing surface-anchored protein n=1 Tax=Mediterraneibacter agrestimuris TaxID=2941333 RepID=UPI00203A9728|nr:VaFE repeat-containing surface-anchored protein [Mediterraneibacter agrestimuris]